MFTPYVKIQPPHIRFENSPVEKRKLVEEGGGVYYVDVDFAYVTPIGSKDTVVKEVIPWLKHLEFEANQTPPRFERDWLTQIRDAYERWKRNEEVPVQGTAIKNWPVATKTEAKILLDVGIRTVEDLVVANEETLTRIGMGARSLQQRGRDWMEGKKNLGPIVEKMDALVGKVNGMETHMTNLLAENMQLKAELRAKDEIINSRFGGPLPVDDRMLQKQADNERKASAVENAAVDEVANSLG